VVKIATFLSTTESIESDFSPVIINISKTALLDTNFGLHFLGFYLTKMLHFWNLKKPYQCRYCNICFNNSSTSVRHEQIHIKGKSSKEVTSQLSIFSCWICQEELSSQELLLEHYDNNMRPE
ncbi:unnamed protein product, partial [Porites lobata]